MAEEDHAGKKRRLQNACDECRRRKIRCDSATAPEGICSNCIAFKTECTHQLQKKKRGPKIGPSRKADSARALVNAILSSTRPFVLPEDPETVKEMLVDLANHARSLDRQLSLARAVGPDTDTPSPAAASPAISNDTPELELESQDDVDSIDALTQELNKVTITHSRRHFGKSSNFMLIQSAMDARRDVVGDAKFTSAIFMGHQRPEFWNPFPWQVLPQRQTVPFVFPEDDLLLDLVNIYFQNVNSFFPLLHRPTFERSIAEGLHLQNRSFGATVLAACAVASRHSSDPRNLCEGTTSVHSLGWKWFRQVPLVRESFVEPPSLYDIQLCSISVFYLQTSSAPEGAWLVIGIGIRSAQEMGIHIRNALNPYSQGPAERELWKRSFWVLISTDVFMSVGLGRPRATTPDDFDIDLPIECDDEYWESDDPQKAFVQPEGKPSRLSFFVTFLKLLDIVGFAQRTLYAVRKSELWSGMGVSGNDFRRKAVMELDSALNKFLDSIPEHLKWNPNNPDPLFFQQSAILYATYYWVQIQVHRPFIPRPGQESPLPFPSLTICANAARSTVNILEISQARREKELVALEMVPNILVPLFAAALILLLNIWRQRDNKPAWESSMKEMTDVYRCLKLVQKYETRYQTAGRILDILTAVLAIGQLPTTRELKRPRSPGDEEERRPAPARAPSHAQKVFSDLHDAIHGGLHGSVNYSKPDARISTDASLSNHPTTSQHPYTGVDVTSSSASLPAIVEGGSGMDNANPVQSHPQPLQPLVGIDYTALQMPVDEGNRQAFIGDSGSSELMLQPDGFPVPDLAWNMTPPGNVDFTVTQEDWDSFMAGFDDIVTGAADYRAF